MNNINRHTASLPAQTQFITNADGTGDHIFTQIKRSGNVAIYRRESVKGGKYGFEVVVLKHIKAGTPLPGNNVVQADYESYPGKSAFGKTAWFCVNEAAAEDRFDRLVKNLSTTPVEVQEPVEAVEMVKFATAVVPVVEVKNDNSSTWNIPVGEFTQAEFAKANELPERGKVYNVLQSVINKGLVKLADRRKSGAGRATCYYVGV
jgi:hypothetical protein